jgi:RNA polymerase sigma factor (sigma-70 family)
MASIIPPRSEEHALVQRVLMGDHDAGARLVERLTPIIRARVVRSVSERARRDGRVHVDDVVQDVFVRLFAHGGRALRAWRCNGGLTLSGFAALLAQRQAATALRSSERRAARELCHDPADLDAAGATRAPNSEVRIALSHDARRLIALVHEQLGHRGREVFQRLYVHTDSPQAISEALDMTLTAVYQWRRRLATLVREHAEQLELPRRTSRRGAARVRHALRSHVNKRAAAANT